MSQEQFVPKNDLEVALLHAATDPSTRSEFYRKLLDAELLFLIPAGSTDAPDTLVQWQGPEGAFVPMFSSMENLQRAVNLTGRTYGSIAIKGQTAFEMLAKTPVKVLMNPSCPGGKKFGAEEIRKLADGSIFEMESRTVQEGANWLLSQPAQYPHEMVEVLKRLFEKHQSVRAAYLAQMHDPSSGEPPHLLVGIESEKDIGAVVRDAGVAIRSVLSKPQFVDFMQMGGQGNEAFDNHFTTQTKPFYQRAETKPRWKFW